MLVAVALLLPAPVVGFGLSRALNKVARPRGGCAPTAIGVSCFGAVLLVGAAAVLTVLRHGAPGSSSTSRQE